MSKTICISLSKYVYDMYLTGNIKNRSKLIEEMIVKGFETELKNPDKTKFEVLELIKQLKDKEQTIIVLQSQIKGLQSRLETLSTKKKREDHLTQQEIDDVKYLFDNRNRDMNYWLYESKRVLDTNRFFLKGRWQLFINTFSYNISKAQFSYLMQLYNESLKDNNELKEGEQDVEEMQ